MLRPRSVCFILCGWIDFFFFSSVDLTFFLNFCSVSGCEAVMLKILSRRDRLFFHVIPALVFFLLSMQEITFLRSLRH